MIVAAAWGYPPSAVAPGGMRGIIRQMSDIERRGSRTPRKQREQRAYRLVLATGAFGLIGVAGLLLAILTSFGAGWPIVSLIIAAICFVLLRRNLR